MAARSLRASACSRRRSRGGCRRRSRSACRAPSGGGRTTISFRTRLSGLLAGDAVTARHRDALFNNIVYVGDLADFFAALIAYPRPGYSVTNIAACDPIRIGDLFSLLFAHAGKPEQITFSEDGKAPFQISLDHVTTLGYRPATVRDSVAAFVRDCVSDEGRAA